MNDKHSKGNLEWRLGEWILGITHRWDVIIGFILLGALLGWCFSYLWPSYYCASRDIYVGLNGYRFAEENYAGTLAGQPFRLMDDYKNWQMEQLNDLVSTEGYMQDTLNLLQENDPYWETVSPEELRQMTSVMWRNAGEWHLILEDTNPDRDSQAVLAWETIILSRTSEAIEHARQVVSLDIAMSRLTTNQQVLELRLEKLLFVRGKIISLMDDLKSRKNDTIITPRELSTVLAVVTQAAEWQPSWNRILNDAPTFGLTVAETLTWVEDVLALIEEEMQIIPLQVSLLDEEFLTKIDQYRTETARSFGLSSTLVIESDDLTNTKVELIRPKGTLILVGAVLGLFAWLIWAFRMIHPKSFE